MRVKILRDLVTRSGRIFRADREHDLSDGEARVLVRRGVAVAVRPARKTKGGGRVQAGAANSGG